MYNPITDADITRHPPKTINLVPNLNHTVLTTTGPMAAPRARAEVSWATDVDESMGPCLVRMREFNAP